MGRQIFEIWPTSQNRVLWGEGRGRGGSENLREVTSSVSGKKNPLTPCMCIYICTYIATEKIYLYLYMCIYVYVLMIWSCTHTIGSCIYMYMYIATAGMYLYIYIYVYLYIYIYMCVYIYMYIDDLMMYTYVYIYMYSYVYWNSLGWWASHSVAWNPEKSLLPIQNSNIYICTRVQRERGGARSIGVSIRLRLRGDEWVGGRARERNFWENVSYYYKVNVNTGPICGVCINTCLQQSAHRLLQLGLGRRYCTAPPLRMQSHRNTTLSIPVKTGVMWRPWQE